MGEDMLFILRDAFTITGRGTVLAGDLVAGSVAIGGDVVVTGPGGDTRVVRITGVERDRKLLDRVSAGPGQVGLLVDGVNRNDVARGSSVHAAAAPSAVAPSGVPAAWLADTTGRHELSYRDGTAWTGHAAGVVPADVDEVWAALQGAHPGV
jgi:translation elongation factor EF-Tu-like GTPase